MNRKERKGWLLALKLLKSGKPLIATFVEEMKPLVAVRDDLHAEINQKQKHNSEFLDYRDSDVRKKLLS